MRLPPRLLDFPRYPVIAGTSLLAIGVTVAWWLKADISPLAVDAMVRRGQFWRLVTTVLPHGGILHLAFNVYWVWVFGTLLEEVYGHFKTAALILLFAAGSSAWEFGILVGGIGLSGVGYGLFGLLWMLSRRDRRFQDAIDTRTVQLFVVWFFFCIFTTVTNIMPVANLAHGTGAILGILLGLAITIPEQRAFASAGLATVLFLGLWAATVGRPRVNLSGKGGYDEGKWGYEALLANQNDEAIKWFRDAAMYQPKETMFWYDLGIAYVRSGKTTPALGAYRRAAELGDARAQYFLASVYESGEKDIPRNGPEALKWYRRLEEQNDADAVNNAAWAYATSSDPTIRNPSAALACAKKAIQLDKENPNPNHLDTLAEALYASGDNQAAIETESQAISLASEQRKSYYEKQLQKYRDALKPKQRSTR